MSFTDVFYLEDDSTLEDPDLAGYDGPGWYFWDEGYQRHGPFPTKQDALESQNIYFNWS